MMRILVVFAALLLAACGEFFGPPPTGPGGMLVLGADTGQLGAGELKELSPWIGDELKRQPVLLLDPVFGRRVEDDHVVIRPGDPANAAAVIARIVALGGVNASSSSPEEIEVRITDEHLAVLRDEALKASVGV